MKPYHSQEALGARNYHSFSRHLIRDTGNILLVQQDQAQIVRLRGEDLELGQLNLLARLGVAVVEDGDVRLRLIAHSREPIEVIRTSV